MWVHLLPTPSISGVFTEGGELGRVGCGEDDRVIRVACRTVPDTEEPSADISSCHELLLLPFGG